MNHKRKRPKNRRAGCLMCKPNKVNGFPKRDHAGHRGGFNFVRKWQQTKADLKDSALES